MPESRTYRITLTVNVDPAHVGYDDPEWIADAAWGCLKHEYYLDCTYGPTELIAEGTQGSNLR